MATRVRVLLLVVSALLLVGISSATQVTLSNSATGFTDFWNAGTGVVDFDFTGNCGHSDCVAGLSLFGTTLGTYQMWISGGTESLGNPNSFDVYQVYSNGASMTLNVVLSDGSTLTGGVDLEQLAGGATSRPLFLGVFTPTVATGQFQGQFAIGSAADIDFNIVLQQNTNLDMVYNDTILSDWGPISSGQVVPTPEPGTLGLMASGLLTAAGMIKRLRS